MDIFSEMLEQDEFVQKQRARGEKEGRLKSAKEILISFISICYPALSELAKQQAEKITQQAQLQNILEKVFAANDEATVRSILSSPVSAA